MNDKRALITVAILSVFLISGGVLVAIKTCGSGGEEGRISEDRDGGGAAAGSGSAGGAGRVSISFLYSTEKEEWLRDALERFRTAHPEITIEAEGMGSLDAVRAILAGEKRPTLWSPADTLATNLLVAQWQGSDPLVREGSRWPQSMLLTPLVFVIWESRARVLLGDGTSLTWQRVRDAVSAREGWREIGGDAAWGFVKFGHTDPLRSNSGMQALVLMAYGFYDRQNRLGVPEVTAQPFQDFVRAIESGRQRQDFGAASTGTFMRNMIRQGPSLYDVAVVYEALAISELPRAQGRWETLRVYYPNINMWSDHPICLLHADWVTAQQRQAANLLLDHLMSPEIQRLALRRGYRPGNLDVAVRTTDPDNPFHRYRNLGIRTDVPRVATPPEGSVIQALLQTYQRNSGN